MSQITQLRQLGLFDARVPRYSSYPPVNHFTDRVSPATTAQWLAAVPGGSAVSLYVHIPYCRHLCWFCACRTQATSSDRPLTAYVDSLLQEIALLSAALPADIRIASVQFGGGTPTILPPDQMERLCTALHQLRPWLPGAEFAVEIDPNEIDAERVAVLHRMGMNRASIGVQDFDPDVQQAIGRTQSYELTRDVTDMVRAAGVASLNMDILYGLPMQTRARQANSVQKVLSLSPDRVALFGYAHVPWMAKRQTLVSADDLPDAEARLDLFDIARRLLVWDGYLPVGIDHFARAGDTLAIADRLGMLRRNFQGYAGEGTEVTIGLGASAISRFPQGFAQNASTSSRYAAAVDAGQLATARGHGFSLEDRLRGHMIEEIMCRFTLDLAAIAARFDLPVEELRQMTAPLLRRFAGHVSVAEDRIVLERNAWLIARLAAHALDRYQLPEGRHSRAL